MLCVVIASYGQTVSITVTKKFIVREFRGIVLAPNSEPLAGADVDVFDNPEWIHNVKLPGDVEQKLIATTKTDSDGAFRFKHLPAGKYDVRFRAVGFNEMHYYVVVKSRILRNKRLVVILPLAT